MSSEQLVLHARDLGKRYDIYERPSDRLRQFLVPRMQKALGRPARSYSREFWALRGVSLQMKRGEALGVIGRNGSGKSTLLQLVTGILTPTEGSVDVRGRVAALLELGSGFNPEFTGSENVFLNASLHGLTRRQIEDRFDRIASFADIGSFIHQPVKTYSSGMFVRLAFAVIANVDADILVVDEALAVGDVFFGQKCMRYFRAFREQGGTMLFVSHDSSAVVNLCNRALWIEAGTARQQGEPEAVCREYLRQLYSDREIGEEPPSQTKQSADYVVPPRDRSDERHAVGREFWAAEQRPNLISVSPFNHASESFGIGGAKIVDAGFFDEARNRLALVKGGEPVCLSIFIDCNKDFELPGTGLVLKDRLGQSVFTESSTFAFEEAYREQGLRFAKGDRVRVDYLFPMPVLIEGNYTITLAVAEGLGHDHVQHHLVHDALALSSLQSRLLHGIAGFTSINIRMIVSRESGSNGAADNH